MSRGGVGAGGGSPPSIGQQADPEATGDGSLVAITKRNRTLLTTIAAAAILTGGVITAGRLDVAPAKATAVAPAYVEGSSVALSTDLAGALRTAGGGGGGNPSAGRLDSIRRIDTLRYLADGRLDSVSNLLAGRLDSVRRVDTLRWLNAGKLDTVRAIADRASLTTGGAIGAVQLGSTTGKANVFLTGSITTTAVTADQVILTRTVTAAKTLYVSYACIQARLTAVSATASILGAASIETPSGTKVATFTFTNPTTSETGPVCVPIVEPIGVAASVVIRCVVTPGATTSMLWICNFGGYEK